MLTPQGRRLDHQLVTELAGYERLLLLCGRYEGFDERIRTGLDPLEVSVGDFVTNGGEVPAMLVIDTVIRHVPGRFGRRDEQQIRLVCRSRDAGASSIHAAARVSWHGGAAGVVERQPRTDFAVAGRAEPSSD